MITDRLRFALQKQLEQQIDEQDIPGLVATVAIPGNGRFTLTAGFEDLQRTRRIHANARFLIYSITKTFISAMVLRLVQRKVLALDDRLSTWLPEIDFASSITVRQLLNHTSGLPDYGSLLDYQMAVEQGTGMPWSFSEFHKRTCGQGLTFEPGQRWAYSNIGYMFLTKIIERAAGELFDRVFEAEILSPVHLSATSLADKPEDLTGLVPGYSKTEERNGVQDVREWYHPGWVAHRVLASTANEVNQFCEELFEGRLINPQYLSEMLHLVPIHDHPAIANVGYGLGIAGETDPTFGPHYGHEGSGPGYRVIASHAPKLCGTTITVFCNNGECNPRKISDKLMHAIFQALD